MRRSTITLVIATCLSVVSSAPAKTLYVDNQLGNDRASGQSSQVQSEDGPLLTINAAMRLAERSDRIVIANTGVPYRESISLSLPCHSGTSRNPFVIQGNGAVLDGTLAQDLGAWKHFEGNVFSMRPRRLTYQQLFTGGQPLQRMSIASRFELNQLQPDSWAWVNSKFYFRTSENKIPAEYSLRHAGLQTGITLYAVRHVIIENLVLQGFQQDGINAHELVKDCQLIDIESRANGRAGLSVGGVSRVSAIRSNFYDNGRVQVRTEGLATLAIESCDIDDTAGKGFAAGGRSLVVDGVETNE